MYKHALCCFCPFWALITESFKEFASNPSISTYLYNSKS